MNSLLYYYSKFFKKIVRWKSVSNSVIDKTAVINSGSSVTNTTMGRYSYCGYDCEFLEAEIGAFCSISDHVFIGGDEHPLDWLSTSPVFQDVGHSGPARKFARHELPPRKKVVVGNDVWIGHGATVMSGVTIGNGAVIGAGAVVTKNVPDYAVVAGVPAKVIRYRFDEETIAALLKSEWWNMPEDELKEYAEKATSIKEIMKLVNNQAVKMGG